MKLYLLGFTALACALVIVTLTKLQADEQRGGRAVVPHSPAAPLLENGQDVWEVTLAEPEALGATDRLPSDPILAGSDEPGPDLPVPASPTLEEADVLALERSFEALHFYSTREQLLETYEAAMERIPSEQVETLHARLLDLGQVEVIDAKATTTAEGYRVYTVPREVRRQNRPVLSRTHYLADGAMHRTWIEPKDMPAFEQDIRYADWLMDRIRGQ
jgi:hypothetical protein